MKLLKKASCLLLTLLMLNGCGGQKSRVRLAVTPKRNFGKITGVVLDEENKPLVNAEIRITSKRFQRTVSADNSGKFKFEHIPLGAFTLAAGPATLSRHNQAEYADKKIIQYLTAEKNVILDFDNPVHEVRFTLKTGKTLRGRLFQDDGKAGVRNVEVKMKNLNKPTEFFVTTTSKDGSFEFFGLEPVNYSFGYEIKYLLGEKKYYPLTIDLASHPVDKIIAVKQENYVSFAGRVKKPDGGQAVKLELGVYPTRKTSSFFGHHFFTDSYGRFTVNDLLPGDYDLYLLPEKAAPAKYLVTLGKQEAVSGMEFTLEQGGRIKGNVINSLTRNPLDNLKLVLYGHDIFKRLYTKELVTDKYGEFNFERLINGDYTIIVYDKETDLELRRVSFRIKDYQKIDDYIIEAMKRKDKITVIK